MKSILLFFLVFICVNVFAQSKSDSTGMKMFNRGFEYYEKGNLDSSLVIWTEIVEKEIGKKYDTYGNAFFNIPTLYWQMKKYDKAKEWYLKILASDLHDFDETGNLMEPHTNYKHKSAMALAGLAQRDSNYTEVLNWLNRADTTYRYWGFEGSATNISMEQAYMLNWKVAVLLKLKKKEEAIREIVTELIFADHLESFFKEAEETLFSMIDKNNFKSEFDKSLSEMTIQTIDENNWNGLFTFHGLQYKIPVSKAYPDANIPHYWSIYFIGKNQEVNKGMMVDYIKSQGFYKKLTN